MRNGDLSVDSALTVSDRDDNPRFYPLKSDNVHFTLAGDYVRATGHAAAIRRADARSPTSPSSTGCRPAPATPSLDVPGLTFGPNLQPERTHAA